MLSHISELDLQGARVRWSSDSGAGGQFLLPSDIAPGSVLELQPVRLNFPKVDAPTIERLEIELRLRNGHRASENSYDLCLLPTPVQEQGFPVQIHGEHLKALESTLKSAASAGFESSLVIADRYDDQVAAHLQSGGRVLMIASSEDALPPDWPIEIQPRSGTELDGRWFSNFNWIRREKPPFASVAFSPILGFESMHVAPEYIIRNIAPEHFSDVLSGITYGWLNNNSGLAMQMKVGPGKLLLTTYKFPEYGSDPYSTTLLDSLIRYALSADFQPILANSPVPAAAVTR
jgi:hypothetical protein